MVTDSLASSFEPDESLALARHEIQNNQLAAALNRLKTLVRAGTGGPQATVMLARLHGQLGLPARAQVGFEQYLAAQPDALHERFELGLALLEQGQAEAALGTWQEVLRQQPAYPPALYFSALAHQREGRTDQAAQALRILFETSPPDNAYHVRGRELLEQLPRQSEELSPGPAFTPVSADTAIAPGLPQHVVSLPENFDTPDQYNYGATVKAHESSH